MDVGMQKQVLSPGVQDADHADLCAQVFAIDSDLQQGLRAGGEQQVVEQTRVLQRQHIEFVGHSEHDMEVTGGQEFAFAGRQPALAGLRLTLGAVPVSARVIRDSLMRPQLGQASRWPPRAAVRQRRMARKALSC